MFRRPVSDDAIARQRSRVAVAAIMISCGASGVSLLGWVLHRPDLQGLGFAHVPAWPLTSVANLCLALALGLTQTSRPHLARLAVAPALLIAGLMLVEYLVGRDIGIDRLLFPAQLLASDLAYPGRIGLVALISVVALVVCILLIDRNDRRTGQTILVLTSSIIGLATMSITSLLLGVDFTGSSIRLTSSLPSAIPPLALSVALLAGRSTGFRHDAPLPSVSLSEWRHAKIFFPLVVVASVVLPLAERAAAKSGFISDATAAFLGSSGNLLIVAGLLSWAVRGIRLEQRALSEVSLALDVAAIMLTRTDGEIVYWSHGCEALLGWTREETVGRSMETLLGFEGLELAQIPVQISEGNARAVWANCRKGGRIPLIVHGRLLDHPEVEPVRVHSMLDITTRIEVEKALRESELKLAQALESHEVGVFDWNIATGGLEWSSGAEQRLGLEPGTITDFASWRARVEPEDVLSIMHTMEGVRATRADRFTFRYRLSRPGGPLRTIEGSGRCFYENGELVRAVGVNLDVTAREEREAALEAGQAQLRAILETVPDAMVVVDEGGRIESFSAAAERMFGYAATHVVGSDISLLLPAAASDGHIARFLASRERRAPGDTGRLTARHADGSEIPIELNLGEAWAGGKHMFIGFLHDLTPRIAAEERLEKLRSEYAHSARLTAMGEMAATLAHELNQPLTAIANFLATAEILLQERSDPSQIGDLLSMANGQSLRAGEIIRRLREFLARNEIDIRAEPVEDALREAIALAMVGSQQYQIRTDLAVAPDAQWMLADRIQIQQVLVNLLRNASHALRDCPPDRRTIAVSVEGAGEDMIEIAVADRGPGLPEVMVDRLYDPFSSTKEGEGMGIGLRICRRIVEAHGGTMSVNSVRGEGVRMAFTLQRPNGKILQGEE